MITRSIRITTALLSACALLALAGTATASAHRSDLRAARAATAPFRDIGTAINAGYGRFLDANGIACIDNPGVGAMGIHYVNGTLVGDGVVDPRTPEALVYEPGEGGRLRLVAAKTPSSRGCTH